MNTMTVGILSDTHGIIHPGVLKRMNSCDLVVHAGDICGGHVLEQLTPLSGEVIAVRGNNDVAQYWENDSIYSLTDLDDERRVDQ